MLNINYSLQHLDFFTWGVCVWGGGGGGGGGGVLSSLFATEG